MAISKLDFARGQVVNPLDSIGDDLLKFGSSLHQQDKDRLAAEKQNEMLNMQKQEHQMKLDEQARQLAETDNYKKFVVGLSAPKEMAEASALYNQNNNPILQKQVNDMAFAPTDTPEDVARKTKLQEDLGKFGSTMSAMPEFKETEYQKGKRILAGMGDSAPLAAIKQLREMEAAQIASDAAKSKDLTETAKHAQDSLLKLQIEAAKNGTGDTITTTNGTVLPIGGGNSKVYNPFSFGVKQTEDKVKNYEEGTKALTSRMDALGAGKAEDVKTGQRIMAMDALNKYAAEGYDPADLASIITTKFQKEPSFYEVWKDKQTGIVLTPEELKPLEAKRTATATLDNMKLQEAQFASVLAQARNGGATGAEILKVYGPVYQNQIAKAEADKALLALTPEQRQAQATMSYLGKMMAPKADATGDKAVKGSSAEEVDAGNLVPKQKEAVDTTVNYIRSKHGLNSAQAYAIAANGLSESGFDNKATGDKGTAAGYFQHRLDRQEALKKFAGVNDVSKIPLEKQLDFVVAEMAQRKPSDAFVAKFKAENPGYQGFVSQLDEFKSFTDPKDAAAYFSANYEVAKGSSTKEGEAARRGEIAGKLFDNQPKQEARDLLIAPERIREAAVLKKAIDTSKIRSGMPVLSSSNNSGSIFGRTNYSTETVKIPEHKPTGDTVKDLATVYKNDDNQGILDKFAGFIAPSNSQATTLTSRGTARAASVLANDGYETPEQIEAFISQSKDSAAVNAARNVQLYKMRQDPKYADILRNKDMSEIRWAAGEGLLGAVPLGKLVQKVGGKVLPGLADDGMAIAEKVLERAPITTSTKTPEFARRSAEVLAEAEARRRKFMQGNQYTTPIGPRPAGLQ